MSRNSLLLAAMLSGAIAMTGSGCGETHSGERVAYTAELPDNFNWSAYQAIPKAERSALAPLQKEWLDLVDRSLRDFRAAYAAKNAVARDALLADAVAAQQTGYEKLMKRIDAEGIDNWAFHVSDEGLVMGPAIVFDYWTTGSFLDPQVHYAVSQSFLLKVHVDWRSVAADSRQVIGSASPGKTVFASLPPNSFTISFGTGGPVILAHRVAHEDPLPALAAPRRWLNVKNHDRLRLSAKRDPQRYRQLLADKARDEAEAQAAAQMRQDEKLASRKRMIAKLQDELVHHIYANDISPSAVRRWLGRTLDGDSYQDVQPEPNSLVALKGLGHSLNDLLRDTRIAFAVAHEPADKGKLAALVDRRAIRRDFFGNAYGSPLADEASRQLRLLVRCDVESNKILIDANGLPMARFRATSSGRIGHLWMTRLAQLAVLWEQGEAIVISPDEQNVRFSEGSLAAHLKSLPHESAEIPGGYSTPAMQRERQARGVNFANFDRYLEAIRRGEVPRPAPAPTAQSESLEERNRRSLDARRERLGR